MQNNLGWRSLPPDKLVQRAVLFLLHKRSDATFSHVEANVLSPWGENATLTFSARRCSGQRSQGQWRSGVCPPSQDMGVEEFPSTAFFYFHNRA